MNNTKLHPTRCAICDIEGNAIELYPANFDLQAFNPDIFSARRLPDLVRYRIVKCKSCGLVRSDPVAERAVLTGLYSQSSFNYNEELANIKQTYGRYLSKLAESGAKKGALLEIGCGNGFFLEEALQQGYQFVSGVEPSSAALEAASEQIRPLIKCDIMHSGLFAPDQFDVIATFQVLDHVSEPGDFLAECFRVLKPGGLLLCLNHNIEALSARLLKERSPIIDIEHTYLYSPDTMSRLFTAHKFKVVRYGRAYNKYSLYYLMRSVPLPAALKSRILSFLKNGPVGRIALSVALGNMYFIAQKP